MLDGQVSNTDLRLVESEARYRAVIENASDMIQSVLPDGTFEFVNDAWRSTLGYTDDDLAGMTVFEIIHPDFIEHCMADFMRAISGETVDFLETRFLTKDGRTVPVEGSVTSRFLGDEVVATHGFFRDISEQLRARELEIRAAELEHEERARYLEKMAALGKLSAGLVHELNNPVAAMQRANAGLKATLDRRDAAMLELVRADLEPADWRAIEQLLDRAQRTDLDPVTLSTTETAIEGWMEKRGIARAWELAPTLAGAGMTVEDLTALATQTPAPSLPAALQWITEKLMLDESTEIVTECCRRIADLMVAIKGYSHMDGATEYDGDIHDGLENTLIILANRLHNIDIVRHYDRSIPLIHMYGNTLNQVWTNILDNALDAMHESGRIAIRTMTRDDHVVIEFEDDGCGIAPDALPRIFEPFYTSKPQGQGIGLGLDTVWRIVTREHAGTITVTSDPGQTIFQISLPLAPLPQTETAVI